MTAEQARVYLAHEARDLTTKLERNIARADEAARLFALRAIDAEMSRLHKVIDQLTHRQAARKQAKR